MIRYRALAASALLIISTSLGGQSPTTAQEPSAELPTPQDLEAAQRIREGFRFRAEPAFVLSSYSDPIGFPDREWSIPLTVDEAAEVRRRVAAQHAVDPAAAWADEHVADYAGLRMDQEHGARAQFHMKDGGSADSRSELAALIPDGVDYEFVSVTRSLSELLAIQEAFRSEWDNLQAQGIPLISTAVNTESNTVLVGLEGRTAELETALRSKFGEGLSFREDRVAHADVCPWTQCLPAKGGIRMVSQQVGNPCTTGWTGKVTTTSGYYYVMVTAGHCFRAGGDSGEGDDWRHYQGSTMTKFGDAELETWFDNAGGDVGLIDFTTVPAVRNDFIGWEDGGLWDNRSVTSRATNAEIGTEDFLCRMGGNLDSGYACGWVTNPAVDHESEIGGIGSMTIRNQVEVGFDSLPGDSGGSVYNNFKAYGTHTHSNDPEDPGPSLSWFTSIGRGESTYLAKWGVSYKLCLNASCSLTD